MTRKQAPLTKVRVGDKVRVAQECGVILEVQGWADVVSALSEPEAVEFRQQVVAVLGVGCEPHWQRALVQLPRTLTWVVNDKIEVIGRHG